MHHFTIKPSQTVDLDDTFLYEGKCYRVCAKIEGCVDCIFYRVACRLTPDCWEVIFKAEPNQEE